MAVQRSKPDTLSVAMMPTYKLDMAAVLKHLAVTNGMSVAYKQQTPKSCRIRVSAQNSARAKQRRNEADNAQGPPDKKNLILMSCV